MAWFRVVKSRRVPDTSLRLSVLGIVVTSLFITLFARLFYLQIIDGSALAAAAQANQTRTIYESAPRGRIVDRKGSVLAGNQLTDVITVDRGSASKDAEVLDRLATLLGIDMVELQRRLDDPNVSPYRPVLVADGVSKDVIAALRERQIEFPGVNADTRIERWYPNGTLAAHLLGYVGDVSAGDLAAHKTGNYRPGDQIGKSGVEAAYETALRGKPGMEKLEVDSSGRVVRVVQNVPPVPGDDVTLTIDLGMQKAAETALARSPAQQRANAGSSVPVAPAGSVVAIDPRDGSVRVMASFPTFDPAQFAKGISADQYAALTSPNGGLALTNRAIQGQYAPGSTFKLVTAISALETNLITPDTTIVDTGSFQLGSLRLHNAQNEVYGPLTLSKALTVSSDVFFYNLGYRFWQQRSTLANSVQDPIQDTARQFGLGSRSGVPIAGEAQGRIPDPQSRRKLHAQSPGLYPEGNWYAGDNVNVAIGQGDTLVTPLQLADLYAIFASGGDFHRPGLVSNLVDTSGKVVETVAPQLIRHVNIAPRVRQPIEQGLMGAVTNPKGTATAAFVGFPMDRFPVAGKTGTAQVSDKGDSALFVGYGPVGSAQIAVSVVLEQAGFGGTAAAPVGAAVLAAAAAGVG